MSGIFWLSSRGNESEKTPPKDLGADAPGELPGPKELDGFRSDPEVSDLLFFPGDLQRATGRKPLP